MSDAHRTEDQRLQAQALGSERVTPMISPGGAHYIECGLSKRELFAAMMMQGFAADPATNVSSDRREEFLRGLAKAAVGWADALLKELAK